MSERLDDQATADMSLQDICQLPAAQVPVEAVEMPLAEDVDAHEVSRRGLFKLFTGHREQTALETAARASAFADLPPAPPSPDEVDRLGVWRTMQVNRRSVLGGLALFALGANSAFRRFLDNSYPRIKPELVYATGEIPDKPEQMAFFFPGFGDMHTALEMKQIRKKGEFPNIIPLVGFNESQYDATPTEKARLAKKEIDTSNLRSIILLGRSMGGQDAWEFAAEFGVPVRKIFMFSSPFSLSNGFDGEIGKLFGHAPVDRELAFLGKLIYGWQGAKTQNGYFDVFANIKSAWDEALSGDDPVTLEKRAKASLNNNLWKLARTGRLDNVITKDTDVYYTGAEHPYKDHTVHVVAAADEYRQLCEYLHAPYHHMSIAEGHANVPVTARELAPVFEALRLQPKTKILADPMPPK